MSTIKQMVGIYLDPIDYRLCRVLMEMENRRRKKRYMKELTWTKFMSGIVERYLGTEEVMVIKEEMIKREGEVLREIREKREEREKKALVNSVPVGIVRSKEDTWEEHVRKMNDKMRKEMGMRGIGGE